MTVKEGSAEVTDLRRMKSNDTSHVWENAMMGMGMDKYSNLKKKSS